MNSPPPSAKVAPCSEGCSVDATAEQLNAGCYCLAVEPADLRRSLESELASQGLPTVLIDTHPNLFSGLPVYLSPPHIEKIRRVVAAVEEVAALETYRRAVLEWAPDIARFDPGSPGGLLGLDFHLGPDGPRLIEINTNPGGVLLNSLLGQAQGACLPELAFAPTEVGHIAERVLHVMIDEWELQQRGATRGLIAIVDETPNQQYLYPEFVMVQRLLERHGYRAAICAPDALVWKQEKLWLAGEPVDCVYNRLTDFSLQQSTNAAIRSAYLAKAIALSPHPRAHALYADKRNLVVLGSERFLASSGATQGAAAALLAAVPRTELLTPENREDMWARRGQLFFKPAAGFGSKASYRGDKLTRRVWDEIAAGSYIAQQIVPPSERQTAEQAAPLKVDIRCYAYGGEALLFAARMYRGQTTNFRTPGGGFAPVFVQGSASVPASEARAIQGF